MHRIVLHVPVGAACALLTRLSNTLAAILAALFVVYEINQDRHKRDHAYKDIAGAAWGAALGGLLLLFLKRRNGSGPEPSP